MSSSLMSRVPACAIRIESIPTRPIITVARVVRHEDVTVFLDDKGRIYSTGIKNGFAYTPGHGNSRNHVATYQCLVKLGVISKADADEHERIANEISDRRSRKYAAEALVKNAEEVGLKLTAAQVKKIEAAKATTA